MNAEAANFDSIGQGRLKSRFYQVTPPPTRSTRRDRASASTPPRTSSLRPVWNPPALTVSPDATRMSSITRGARSDQITFRDQSLTTFAQTPYLNKIICLRR